MNMATILRQIWKKEQVSRVELVSSADLTSGTITNLTGELIGHKVIREYEAVSGSVGRKRVMLGFDPGHYRIIGLDIGRNNFEIVLMDLCGRVLRSVGGDVDREAGPEGFFARIMPALTDMRQEAEKAGHPMLGIGVGVPGPIDYSRGALLNPPNFPGWSGFPLQAELEKRTGGRVMIEDNARTSALAERWYGIGRNVDDLVFITMGGGIGGGVISQGEIVRGTNGLCGQVGHMTIVMDGKVCDCGNRGCWEPIGSIPGILGRWGGGGTMDDFKAAVRAGDSQALKCMEDTLAFLETALINVFNLYDPEVVVLGGQLYPYIAEYRATVQERLQARLYAFAKDRLRLEPSSFGASQSAIGGAAMLFRELLSEPVKLLA
ncbi:MAG: ROK family protein [Paenibacillaceae bacterium]|nr:ROK family protein [Paenibacillaceae bacterium]